MKLKNIQEYKKDLIRLQQNYEKDDIVRERIISLARKALKPSKQAIYAAHRDEINEAKKLLKTAKDAIVKAQKELSTSSLGEVGMLNASIEEFIEGSCYVSFIKENKIPLINDFGFLLPPKTETYLQATCDFAGELAKRAVIAAIKGEKEIVINIYHVLEDLLKEFMKFDFRSGELRKKTESLKYSLNKVESILYDLKINAR